MNISLRCIPLLFFIFIFSLFCFPYYVHSQASDSCNVPLNLQTPLPFDTTSLHCATVWSAQSYILRYAQASPNVWNFMLSAPNTNAFIAMGFSPDGNMIGSRAVVGWVGSDGTLNIRKYFLGGKSSNLVTLESSTQGLQIANSSITLQSDRIYMAFQLIIASPTTRLIYSAGPIGILPSGPNFRLTEHRDHISTSINYATGEFQTQQNPGANLRRVHGLLNMVGWAILLPIGAMVARYMRRFDPQWFYSHAIIQIVGFSLGLSGVICGLVLENQIQASVNRHKGIGLTVLILGCLQVLAVVVRPGKESKVRKYWNWYHFGVGRVLIFLAAINVFYGIHLGHAGSQWNAGFAAVLIILFIITLILEIRRCLKK